MECFICQDEYDLDDPHQRAKLTRPCRKWCKVVCEGCLEEMFTTASKTCSRMPPRCSCGLIIQLHAVRLSEDIRLAYQQKFVEWATPKSARVYCPIPTCSAFVPPSKANHLSCPECDTAICLDCKQVTHPGSDCQENHDFRQLWRMLSKMGYKECPGCGTAVRKMYGCSHVICGYCATHFCWGCLQPSSDCKGDISCDYEEDPASLDSEYDTSDDEYDDVYRDSNKLSTDSIEDNASPASKNGSDNIVQTHPCPPRRRRRDLDVADLRGGMNFGEEPDDTDVVEVWACSHSDCHLVLESNDGDAEEVGCDLSLQGHHQILSHLQANLKPRKGPLQCHLCWNSVVTTTGQGEAHEYDAVVCHRCNLLMCRSCRAHRSTLQGHRNLK